MPTYAYLINLKFADELLCEFKKNWKFAYICELMHSQKQVYMGTLRINTKIRAYLVPTPYGLVYK